MNALGRVNVLINFLISSIFFFSPFRLWVLNNIQMKLRHFMLFIFIRRKTIEFLKHAALYKHFYVIIQQTSINIYLMMRQNVKCLAFGSVFILVFVIVLLTLKWTHCVHVHITHAERNAVFWVVNILRVLLKINPTMWLPFGIFPMKLLHISTKTVQFTFL